MCPDDTDAPRQRIPLLRLVQRAPHALSPNQEVVVEPLGRDIHPGICQWPIHRHPDAIPVHFGDHRLRRLVAMERRAPECGQGLVVVFPFVRPDPFRAPAQVGMRGEETLCQYRGIDLLLLRDGGRACQDEGHHQRSER